MVLRSYLSGWVSALALLGLAAGQSLPVVDLLTSVHRGQVSGNVRAHPHLLSSSGIYFSLTPDPRPRMGFTALTTSHMPSRQWGPSASGCRSPRSPLTGPS